MKSYLIHGGSGVSLFVVECGNPYGKPIIFVHGALQSHLSWIHQLQLNSLKKFRLIAFDLRGHGFSEKPKDGYHNQRNWADDIHSIIDTLKLKKAVLVGWSYGGKVVLDYIKVYGDEHISGINLVDAGTSSSISGGTFYSAASQAIIHGLTSNNTLESLNALKKFVNLLFYHKPSISDFYLILGYNTIVPPYVRKAIITRTVSYDDLLPTIKVPVLLTHGVQDKILNPNQSIMNSKIIPCSTLSIYKMVGHSPFSEDPNRFNRELAVFTTRC